MSVEEKVIEIISQKLNLSKDQIKPEALKFFKKTGEKFFSFF